MGIQQEDGEGWDRRVWPGRLTGPWGQCASGQGWAEGSEVCLASADEDASGQGLAKHIPPATAHQAHALLP